MRRLLILPVFGSLLWGQARTAGVEVKEKPAAYAVSGNAGKLEIGAEWMGRTFAGRDGKMYDAGDFVVVEVGVFATPAFRGGVKPGDFKLVVDGRKVPLLAVSPEVVAMALRTRDRDPRGRGMVVGGGMGNAQVVLGGPRVGPRFPGDPQLGRTGGVVLEEEGKRDWDAVVESGLVEGPLASRRAGNLFFDYKGKMTKVKTLALLYEGEGGTVELKLR